MRRWPRVLAFGLAGSAGLALLLAAALHLYVGQRSMTPPDVGDVGGPARKRENGFVRMRGGLREVHLRGSPAELGAAHGALLHDRMMENEGELWGTFEKVVPLAPARFLFLDLARLQYRHVDSNLPKARAVELSAEARAVANDRFASKVPTYERLVLLHALYDIALSFEQSRFVGCSTFGLGPAATRDGHTLLARAFDFEAGEAFDRDKAVYFVAGDGTIPFASVAWPGLVGVVSGMNREGLAVVVHGGRAGPVHKAGVPLVFSMRGVLEQAKDVDEAAAILSREAVMVSHIVIAADAKGHFAVVERAPGSPATVRRDFADPSRVAVTNHFEGPLAADPKNDSVRRNTTTLARRARLDEMLAALGPSEGDVPRAVAMLRDHRCAGGAACALGDRRAIDALIATHGIVADTTAKVLWVSAGPGLSGQFVGFDLNEAFTATPDAPPSPAPTVAADPAAESAEYNEVRARARGHGQARGDKR